MIQGPFFKRQLWLVIVAVMVMVTASIAATVGLMYRAFDTSIAPQMLEKAKTAGRSLNSLLGQAATHAIPLEKLVGVGELFADTARDHPEIARLELLREGRAVQTHGPAMSAELTTRIPVPGYEAEKAELAVSIDPQYVRRLFEEMTLDLLVVAVVALFISLELLYFLAGGLLADLGTLRTQVVALSKGSMVPLPRSTWLGRDLSAELGARVDAVAARYTAAVETLGVRVRERSAGTRPAILEAIAGLRTVRSRFRFPGMAGGPGASGSYGAALILGAMRAPFFLLLLADDLSRSFMPSFAAGLEVGPLPLSPNMVASLPIFAFMLVVALSQPVLGGWSERTGRRRSFLAGAALACFAHLLSAQATTLLELLAWRSVGGAAWAIAFVAAQGYVLDHTDAKTRTVGLAAFVGIIMVSMICGPSIGGILADGIGHRATLALGGVLTLAALLLAWRRLPVDVATGAGASATAATRPRLSLAFSNRRFLLLLLLAAVPAKLILIAYCFYLIPLYILDAGSSSAMAGRMIMLYSVMMVLLVPWMANWVVALRARRAGDPEALFVAAGLALSGLAGLAMALPLGLVSPLILVLLLGVGQALSISPQAAMVAEVCRDEIRSLGQSAVYGVYRMVERMGNASGPLVAAALLEFAGFRTAFVAIGVLVLTCAALFAVIFVPRRATPATVAKAAS